MNRHAAIAAYGHDPLAQHTFEELRAERMAGLAQWWQGYEPDERVLGLLQAYRIYRDKGILPYSGGWLEQPLWVVAAFVAWDMIHEFYRLQRQIEDENKPPPVRGRQWQTM